MTDKETGELRRRYKPDRTNITAVYGCYVSGSGEILSEFRQPVALMSEEDKEKYLALLKKVLSGAADKNRLDLAFRTAQVADSDEHRLLMKLRDSELQDEEARAQLFQTIIGAVHFEENYLILLAHEKYDVPFKAKDGAMLDDSDHVYSYFVCAICPVKAGKETLSYETEDKAFHIRTPGYAAAMPELGFLFPAFDGRQTNLYNCLYYTRSAGDNHPELIEALFHITPPLPADEQKGSFDALLSQTLGEECSMEVVQAVQTDLRERIEVHKETKSDEPLVVSGPEVRAVLENAGVSEEKLAGFQVKFEETFGDDAALSPRNLVDSKRMQLKTPDVIIHVAPDRGDLVETRTLGGVKYIMVRAEDGVELNGRRYSDRRELIQPGRAARVGRPAVPFRSPTASFGGTGEQRGEA